jgi:hypothetical protein
MRIIANATGGREILNGKDMSALGTISICKIILTPHIHSAGQRRPSGMLTNRGALGVSKTYCFLNL